MKPTTALLVAGALMAAAVPISLSVGDPLDRLLGTTPLARPLREAVPTRATALAGLGRLLDAEFHPSLARLTMWMNYRASTDLINQLYGIL